MVNANDVCDALYIFIVRASCGHFCSTQATNCTHSVDGIKQRFARIRFEHLFSIVSLATLRLGVHFQHVQQVISRTLCAYRCWKQNDIRGPKLIIAYVSVAHSRGEYAGERSHFAAVFLMFRRKRAHCGEGGSRYAFRLIRGQPKVSLLNVLPQKQEGWHPDSGQYASRAIIVAGKKISRGPGTLSEGL
jgi:hypothetical protein